MVPPDIRTGFFCIGATTGLCASAIIVQAEKSITKFIIFVFIVLAYLLKQKVLVVLILSGYWQLSCFFLYQFAPSFLHQVLHRNRLFRQPLFCLPLHKLKEDDRSREPDRHLYPALCFPSCHQDGGVSPD